MTELAALNIRITGDSKDLQTAITAANGDLAKLVAGAEAAGLRVKQIPFKPASQGASEFSHQLRGMTQQLSQVGQQTMATGNFLQALAIQLPDIGLGFGAVGTAAGLLAGIALPMVATAFMGTGDQARTLTQSLDALKDSVAAVSNAAEVYSAKGIDSLIEKYGALDAQVLALIANQTAYANILASKDLKEAMATLQDAIGGSWFHIGISEQASSLINLQSVFDMTANDARSLKAAFDEVAKAQTYDEQAVALAKVADYLRIIISSQENVTDEQLAIYDAVIQSLEAVKTLAASQPKQGWLSAAISQAQTLASSLWDAVAAKAAVLPDGAESGGPGMTTGNLNWAKTNLGFIKSGDALLGLPKPASGAGGGGGGGVNPLQGELEALQQSLLSQEQIEAESHMRRLEMLKSALDQRLITQQEYAALMEQVERTHQFAMGKETREGISATLTALGGLFEGSKKIGAAVALANSWLAFTEVLKDPAYAGRPWARFAAAASALSSGLNAVRNIKSAQPGGATTGGGATAAAPPSSGPLQVSLNTFGGGDFIRTADFGMILDRLNQEAGDRGYTILGASA